MNGINHADDKQHATSNGHSKTNGHVGNGHVGNGHLANGYTNGYAEQVAVPEMCFYCFDVLNAELNNTDVSTSPSFTNDA